MVCWFYLHPVDVSSEQLNTFKLKINLRFQFEMFVYYWTTGNTFMLFFLGGGGLMERNKCVWGIKKTSRKTTDLNHQRATVTSGGRHKVEGTFY